MHTDKCGNIREQKYRSNGNRKEEKVKEFKYRDTKNMEREMCGHAGNIWSHWNRNKIPIATAKEFLNSMRRLGEI